MAAQIEQLPLAIDLFTAEQLHIGICHADPVFNDWQELLTALDTYQAQQRETLIENWSGRGSGSRQPLNLATILAPIKSMDWTGASAGAYAYSPYPISQR